MFKYILAAVGLFYASFAGAKVPTFANVLNPPNYLKRSEPVLNIGLVYYGTEKTAEDVARIQSLLETRFFQATDSSIRLNAVFRAQIPYKHKIEDHPEYQVPNITDRARLQRLWYYDNVGSDIVQEIYDETKAQPDLFGYFSKLDGIASMTGAQFDGMGFALGRVAVTESPREIAWGLPDGGRTDETSDATIVDELLHEIGHTLFLDHAASQCFLTGMGAAESKECCAQSENKDDVMSYCRARNQVSEEFFYGFKACNLRILKNQVIPAMLSGGAWNVTREKCR